jgi:hypothetical protein
MQKRRKKLTNESYFMNIIADPNQHGIWMNECGKTYLLGREIVQLLFGRLLIVCLICDLIFQVNWTQNKERCCSLGMQPISFGSTEEQACFGKLSSNGISDILLNFFLNKK